MKLTVGMPVYKDYEGVFFTLQALTLYHRPPCALELLVIDTAPEGCAHTKNATERVGGLYLHDPNCDGPAAAKDRVFRRATGDAVLCIDCHVLLAPGALDALVAYYEAHPNVLELIQGPLLYDDHQSWATHFDPAHWGSGMWGTWATDPRGAGDEPFEIPMQGAGLLSMWRTRWPGFNPAFRGFGGEEGYIHEKVRRLGGRCLCHPKVRWVHRFHRPGGAPYRLDNTDRVVNYFIGFRELGLDETPIHEHFAAFDSTALVRGLAEADRLWPRGGLLHADEPADEPVAVPNVVTGRPLVSCLCATYGRCGTPFQYLLEEAIQSFLQQARLEECELLVLNDHPRQHFTLDHPRVVVVNTGRRFRTLGDKYNAMAGLAEGHFLCPWDDDDISLPWRVDLSVQLIGDAPYLNPHRYWALDNQGLHHDQSVGVGHNLAIYPRRTFERLKGWLLLSGGADADFDTRAAALSGVCPAERLVDGGWLKPAQWWYVYRWGVSDCHVSSRHPYNQAYYEEIGRRPVPEGHFELRPSWRQDYVRLTRDYLTQLQGGQHDGPASAPQPRPGRYRPAHGLRPRPAPRLPGPVPDLGENVVQQRVEA